MAIPSLSLKFDKPGPVQAIPSDCFATLLKATRSELVAEAMRFFDLRDSGRKGIIKEDWPRLTVETLDRDVRTLRFDYNQAMQSVLHEIYSKDPSDFIRYYKDEEQNFYLESNSYRDAANRARFTARIFMSDLFRTERFVEAKKTRKGYFQGIKLEQIPSKLSALRDTLSEVFKDSELTALPTEAITKLRSCEGPPTEMLSEHLYLHAAMISRQQQPFVMPASIQRAHDAIDSIESALAFTSRFNRNSPFLAYERALNILEGEFMIRGGEQATRFGLQWALLLTTILRVYLAEMKFRILIASLPIFNFYDQYRYNSCIGVCLW